MGAQPRKHLPAVAVTIAASGRPALGVEGNDLLGRVMWFIRHYVVLSEDECRAAALWVIHTYCFDLFDQSPYLSISSPEPRCGKSTLLEVIESIVKQAWNSILPSEAVVYRKIDAMRPTFLLDEVDAIFNAKTAEKYEPLRALLNAGNRASSTVDRCVGTSKDKLTQFSVFCPKLLAGIGTLPSTVADRSIPIRLERKTRDQRVESWSPRGCAPIAAVLQAQIEEWVDTHRQALAVAEPDLPEELDDRARDSCEVLLAIADLLGHGDSARRSLIAVYSGARQDDEDSIRILLLRDMRAVFDDRLDGHSGLHTEELLLGLRRIGESPWRRWLGRYLEANDLAHLLRPYKVHPTTVRRGEKIAKGYKRDDLAEAWERYL